MLIIIREWFHRPMEGWGMAIRLFFLCNYKKRQRWITIKASEIILSTFNLTVNGYLISATLCGNSLIQASGKSANCRLVSN
jgi:hypothetical protein